MSAFIDLCRFNPTAGGTTDWTFSSAVGGCQSPAAAGAVNGVSYKIYAVSNDLTQWEVSTGAYNSSTGTFPRTTVLFNSSGNTSLINFSTIPQVAVVALAEDLIFVAPPQGRLTLQSGVPVMTTSQSAKSTLLYTPYNGNQIPLYDGSSFRNTVFSELSVATTDTTKNPSAIGVSKVNDWFVWNDAGTLRLTHGPDWTSDTVRSAGTALALVNGVLVNSVSITNGPSSQRGTYVGTTRSDGSSLLNYIFGAAASGGTAGLLGVWNMYNRVSTPTTVVDSGAQYNYNSTTIRQARASAGNQIQFILGIQEDGVPFSYTARSQTGAVLQSTNSWGVGFDSITTFGQSASSVQTSAAVNISGSGSNSGIWTPGIGFHTLSANEGTGLGDSSTFYCTGGNNILSLIVRN